MTFIFIYFFNLLLIRQAVCVCLGRVGDVGGYTRRGKKALGPSELEHFLEVAVSVQGADGEN